ncbi:hypothetical protein [Streptomyces sp. ISID311]|uniref:hypothetical protein n=1 Tax=Streptomyces sp. ISID311 TaxID=2601673 RepID=UPI0021C31B11|nr:hypothetical protein [Streptomyces sp. ISID311]
MAIVTQLVQDGWKVHENKTDSGFRLIALDDETNDGLLVHKARQQREREAGEGWQETGRISTQEPWGGPASPAAPCSGRGSSRAPRAEAPRIAL